MRKYVLFRKRCIVMLATLLIAGSAIGQLASSTPGKEMVDVIATVNGVPLYRSQLDSPTKGTGLPGNDAGRAELENGMIAGEVVRQAAEKAKYGERPEVKQVVDAARARVVSELYLHDSVKPAPVSDQQVKARYDEMVAATGAMEYKPRIISVADGAAAKEVLAQLESGRTFDDVAQQYSQASNRAVGGEMGWVSFKTPAREGQTQGLPLPLARELSQLKVGSYTRTPVIVGSDRFILKLDATRPTKVLAFEQVTGQIRRQLEVVELQKATAALIEKLVNEAKIQR
ncbi:peptidyl-prolyl cis-trans isomerase [Burkholderia sp. JSH-S8]|nr:peptidyl-prolyl cis-trans isomerase [Burkholderia sp. JSH-S8]